jgi:hypothetical protein
MLAQIIVSIVGKGQDAGTITKVEQVADIIIDKAALTARISKTEVDPFDLAVQVTEIWGLPSENGMALLKSVLNKTS